MTTKHSPLSQIKAEADNIARMLKAAERGELIDVRFAERIAAARNKPSLVVGIVMDDKVIKLDISWATIQSFGEVALSAFIVKTMRETREN